MEEEAGWMEDWEKNSLVKTEEKRGRGVWRGRRLTLEPRLLFPPSSLHPPVSDAAVWHKSLHLPCRRKERKAGCERRRAIKSYGEGEVGQNKGNAGTT